MIHEGAGRSRRRRPWFVDTTLRDGEQTPGVSFTTEEKVEIARRLSKLPVSEIEVGTPAMGPEEREGIRRIRAEGLPVRLTGWLRAREDDLDFAAESDLAAVHLSFPTSAIHLQALGKTKDWLRERLLRLIPEARQRFEFVSVGFQDSSRSDRADLFELAEIAVGEGVDRIRLADTVGIHDPGAVTTLISEFETRWPALAIGFHGHNDLGLATANTLAAFEAGADSLDVTVNGLGERAGNAALEQVVLAMETALDIATGLDASQLKSLCEYVAMASGEAIADSAPVVGRRCFVHESGVHVRAQIADRRCYEPFDPRTVGRDAGEFVLGKHSGSAGIRYALRRTGIELSTTDTQRVLARIRGICGRRGGDAITSSEIERIYREIDSGAEQVA